MQFNFNAAAVPPSSAPEPWEGWHKVSISSHEVKPTSDGSSGMLVLTLTGVEGPMAGRTHPYRLNIWNANQQAADIAARQLSAICHVTGVYQFQSTEELAKLYGIPFNALFGKQKDNPQYSEVKGVKDVYGNDPGKSNAPQHAPAAAPMNQGFAPQQQPQVQSGFPAPTSAPAAAPQQPAAWGGQQQAPAQPAPQVAQPPAWGQQPNQAPAPQQPPQAAPAPQQQAPAWQAGATQAAPPWGQR